MSKLEHCVSIVFVCLGLIVFQGKSRSLTALYDRPYHNIVRFHNVKNQVSEKPQVVHNKIPTTGVLRVPNILLEWRRRQCKSKQDINKIQNYTTLIRRYRMECIEETRVDPDYIHMIEHGNWGFPQTKEHLVKDWALCVMMKAGLMTREGVYKMDTALSRVPEYDRDAVEILIDKCLSQKAIPANEIAIKFIRCYQKHKGNYTVSIL